VKERAGIPFVDKGEWADKKLSNPLIANVASFTCTPTHLFMNGTKHAFAFAAEAGPHSTNPEGMEGRVGWLHT